MKKVSLIHPLRSVKTAIYAITHDLSNDSLDDTWAKICSMLKKNLFDPATERAYEEGKDVIDTMTPNEKEMFFSMRDALFCIMGNLWPGDNFEDVWENFAENNATWSGKKINSTKDYTPRDFVEYVLSNKDSLKAFDQLKIFYDPDVLVVNSNNEPVWPSPYVEEEDDEE